MNRTRALIVFALTVVVVLILLSVGTHHASPVGAVFGIVVGTCVGAATWALRLRRCRVKAARTQP